MWVPFGCRILAVVTTVPSVLKRIELSSMQQNEFDLSSPLFVVNSGPHHHQLNAFPIHRRKAFMKGSELSGNSRLVVRKGCPRGVR